MTNYSTHSKKIMTLALACFFFGSSPARSDGGFKDGNNFKSHTMAGDVSVICWEGDRTYFHQQTCKMEFLEPNQTQIFVTDSSAAAQTAKLTSHREDGSTASQERAYSSRNHESRRSYNLWTSYFGSPRLLGAGKNTITYELKTGTTVHERGEFSVTVNPGNNLTCPSLSIDSSNRQDCLMDYICRRYFEQVRGECSAE